MRGKGVDIFCDRESDIFRPKESLADSSRSLELEPPVTHLRWFRR
jgi:hypothetical protein